MLLRSALFLEQLNTATSKAEASAPEASDERKLMAVILQALTDPQKPASALVIDRLKRLAKSEWAIAKLEGRWEILPSTAPIGNDSLSVVSYPACLGWGTVRLFMTSPDCLVMNGFNPGGGTGCTARHNTKEPLTSSFATQHLTAS